MSLKCDILKSLQNGPLGITEIAAHCRVPKSRYFSILLHSMANLSQIKMISRKKGRDPVWSLPDPAPKNHHTDYHRFVGENSWSYYWKTRLEVWARYQSLKALGFEYEKNFVELDSNHSNFTEDFENVKKDFSFDEIRTK